MALPQNIFSYFVGALALTSTITSVVIYCQLYLPTSQLKHLDELLLETKEIYRKANEERLLSLPASRYAQRRLTRSAFLLPGVGDATLINVQL